MKLINTICAVLVATVCMVPAWAEPMTAAQAAQAITDAGSGDFYTYGNGYLYISGSMDYDTFREKSEEAINKVFRTSNFCDVRYQYDGNKDVSARFRLLPSEMDKLAYQDDYVLTWCREQVPNIAPNGMTREQAIRAVFDWIIDYAEYDWDYLNESGKYQSAYSLLTTGHGICSSYSKLFRAMLEVVPFSAETGLTDWTCGTEHMEVAIVDYIPEGEDGHEWTAIQDPDGTWKHYDLSYSDYGGSERYGMTEGSFTVCENSNPDDWVWFY